MLSPARLEAYMRRAAACTREVVDLPPFILFFDPADPLRFFNYARPAEPAGGDLALRLGEAHFGEAHFAVLRAAFAARNRLPRVEFIEEFAPDLALALRAAGFVEEARQWLMVCTPDTFRPAPVILGLEIIRLTAQSPEADLRAYLTAQRRGFEGETAPEAAEVDIESQRRSLAAGAGAFLACLDGQPVGAGAFTVPLDGLTELVGIATREAHRRRGVATAVTADAVRTAFARGVGAACLVAEDARAGRVYERVGFRPYATALAYSMAGAS